MSFEFRKPGIINLAFGSLSVLIGLVAICLSIFIGLGTEYHRIICGWKQKPQISCKRQTRTQVIARIHGESDQTPRGNFIIRLRNRKPHYAYRTNPLSYSSFAYIWCTAHLIAPLLGYLHRNGPDHDTNFRWFNDQTIAISYSSTFTLLWSIEASQQISAKQDLIWFLSEEKTKFYRFFSIPN